MAVLRIVPDIFASDPARLAAFYRDVFELDLLMDGGFICTLGAAGQSPTQISVAREGGSGTELPAVSIEVDDLEGVLDRAKAAGAPIPYGPVDEPWGVRRFYLRDPDDNLINVLTHK